MLSNATKITAILSTLLLAGCATPQPLGTNHVQRLLNHPQFQKAKTAAPEFTRDALETINDLQLAKDIK